MWCLNTTSYRAREWFPTQTSVILDVWGITAQFRNWIDWHVWEFLFTSFILVPACRNETANGGWWPAAMDIRSHQLQWLHCSCAAQGRNWQCGPFIWSLLFYYIHPMKQFARYLVFIVLSLCIQYIQFLRFHWLDRACNMQITASIVFFINIVSHLRACSILG